MLRTALLWGNTINLDSDYSKYIETVSDPWVIEGFAVENGKVKPGKAWVKVTRSNGESLFVLVQNTQDIPVSLNGDVFIGIEVAQNAIDNGLMNNEDGTGIASIKVWPQKPNQNYLLLAVWQGGRLSDKREIIPKLQSLSTRTSTLEEKVQQTEGKVEKLEEAGDTDCLIAKIIPNGPVKKKKYITFFNPFPPKAPLQALQNWDAIRQEIILDQIPKDKDKIYISFLLHRKKEGNVSFLFEMGDSWWYRTIADKWHTATKNVKLEKEYGEVFFEVPTQKIKRKNFYVFLSFDQDKINIPVFAPSRSDLNRYMWGYYTNTELVKVTAFYEDTADFNLIGQNSAPWIWVCEKQCVGVTTEESDGIVDVYLPQGEFEYKKGSVIARAFRTWANARVKALSLDWFVEDHNGNITISIYKADASGGIDITQRVFTKAVPKSQFAVGLAEDKNSYPTDTTLRRFSVELSLDANSLYYVVIEGWFVVKSDKWWNYTIPSNDDKFPTRKLYPWLWEVEIQRPWSSISWNISFFANGMLVSGTRLNTQSSATIPINMEWYGELEGGGMRVWWFTVLWHPKQLHISTKSFTNISLERGCPFIGVEFEKPQPIKVILNKSVIHLEHMKFIPWERYYIHKWKLYTMEELQAMEQTTNISIFGLALSETAILLDISHLINEVRTGSVPLGMSIGYMQINGYNVPVYW